MVKDFFKEIIFVIFNRNDTRMIKIAGTLVYNINDSDNSINLKMSKILMQILAINVEI
jgi:hypothetical protein